jgi:hypothetical protein
MHTARRTTRILNVEPQVGKQGRLPRLRRRQGRIALRRVEEGRSCLLCPSRCCINGVEEGAGVMKVCIVAAVGSDAGLNASTANAAECNSTGAGCPSYARQDKRETSQLPAGLVRSLNRPDYATDANSTAAGTLES